MLEEEPAHAAGRVDRLGDRDERSSRPFHQPETRAPSDPIPLVHISIMLVIILAKRALRMFQNALKLRRRLRARSTVQRSLTCVRRLLDRFALGPVFRLGGR